MKGDFTRSTFNPRKQYSGVLMQQGRVQLDSDWNEQVNIQLYRDETTTGDIIGPAGVIGIKGPGGTYVYDGFKFLPNGSSANFKIGSGRMYVDGILCDNNAVTGDMTLYNSQPNYKPTLPTEQRRYLAYLDVWQRHVTALDDPQIQEVALGGPDTTTRIQSVWQVKLLPLNGPVTSCSSIIAEYDSLMKPNDSRLGLLTAKTEDVDPSGTTDPCILPPTAGYRGLENQLYRIEIHQGGTASTATYKWSRDNGAIAVAVETFAVDSADRVRVKSLGRDEVYRLKPGDTVEFITPKQEQDGVTGAIRVINDVDEAQRILILDQTLDSTVYGTADGAKVRRWEGGAPVALPTSGFVTLENGVQIKFSSGIYETGDYWQIPARTETGDIEWPRIGGVPQPVLRQGVTHHYARLAIADLTSGGWVVIDDCRQIAPPLTDLATDFYYVSGDGQEVMPAIPLTQLAKPLQVGVANRQRALKGVPVKFTVTGGTGTITPDSGYVSSVITPNTTIVVYTDQNGIASCRWTPDGTNASQQVKAVMVDASNVETHLPPVKFNASLSKAAQVAYTPPGDCTKLQGVTTVQQALDGLCQCDCEACDDTMHVTNFTFSDGTPFTYGAAMPITLLQGGFRLTLSRPVDPMTINKMTFGFYIYVPFMFSCSTCTSFWYGTATPNEQQFFYQPLFIMPESVAVTGGNVITWQPSSYTFDRLNTVINSLPAATKLMSRLVLKGNFVWAAGAQNVLLGGKLLPTGTAFRPPLDTDCIPEGDFDFWFWFVPVVTDPPSVTVTTVSVEQTDLPCKSPIMVTIRLNGAVTSTTTVPVTIAGSGGVFPTTYNAVFNAGQSVKTFQIDPISPAVIIQNDTSVTVTATYGGSSVPATFNLQHCPHIIKCETNLPLYGGGGGCKFFAQPGQPYTYTVTLDRPARENMNVHVTVTATDGTVIPAFDIPISANANTGSKTDLVVPAFYGSGQVGLDFSAAITTYTVTAGPCVFRVCVQRTDLPTLTGVDITPPKQVPCNGTIIGHLNLSQAVPTGNTVVVNLAPGQDYVSVPSTVTFVAGEATKDFVVSAINCDSLVGNVDVPITATSGSIVKTDIVTVVGQQQTTPTIKITDIVAVTSVNGQPSRDLVRFSTENKDTVSLSYQQHANMIRVEFSGIPDATSLKLGSFTGGPASGGQVPLDQASIVLDGPNAPLFTLQHADGSQSATISIPDYMPPGEYRFTFYGQPSGPSITMNGRPLDGTLNFDKGKLFPTGDNTPGGSCTVTLIIF